MLEEARICREDPGELLKVHAGRLSQEVGATIQMKELEVVVVVMVVVVVAVVKSLFSLLEAKEEPSGVR